MWLKVLLFIRLLLVVDNFGFFIFILRETNFFNKNITYKNINKSIIFSGRQIFFINSSTSANLKAEIEFIQWSLYIKCYILII